MTVVLYIVCIGGLLGLFALAALVICHKPTVFDRGYVVMHQNALNDYAAIELIFDSIDDLGTRVVDDLAINELSQMAASVHLLDRAALYLRDPRKHILAYMKEVPVILFNDGISDEVVDRSLTQGRINRGVN